MSKAPRLTVVEQKAVDDLLALAQRWPKSLWIFSGGGGGACVLKCGADGQKVMSGDAFDPAATVAEIPGRMSIEGGDW